jgi:hypothetical protein
MTILLRWLIDNAWVLYVSSGVAALIFVVKALTAHRERTLALFTLERERATSRVVQSWSTVFVFIALAAIIFVATQYILPEVPLLDPSIPLPTATLLSGVEPFTPSPGPSPTPGAAQATFTPAQAPEDVGPSPTVPPSQPTAPPASQQTPAPAATSVPTPIPTDVGPQSVSGDVSVRFGDFARLVGFTVSSMRTSTVLPLRLTLYWQAEAGQSPIDYMVFTHLIAADGHLVAQHDGPPGSGSKPTTSWLTGESIVDVHTMEFSDPNYVGTAIIRVGLYAPSGDRVLSGTGADHVELPVTIEIVPQ